MLGRLSHTRLLRYAGLFTWALVGVPLLYTAAFPPETVDGSQPPSMAWPGWVAYATFGALYLWLTRAMDGRRIRRVDHVLLLVFIGAALAMSYFSLSGLGSILLMVAACVLPWILPVGLGMVLLVASQFAVAPIFVIGQQFEWPEAILQSMLYAGFCAFIFVTSLVARQQAQARDDQRRLNAELRATRALLAESARVNERTRISRELHDLLGHHLTALSLNLEVAGHLAQGKVQEHVGQAHTLAKLLLSDVREAVSQLRAGGAIDMAATLSPLAENVPGLEIRIDMPDPFLLDDAERAHVLLRCTQEIITNAVRHAQARTLQLDYTLETDAIRLRAQDDGQGSESGVFGDGWPGDGRPGKDKLGNGLRGLRERLACYGGQVGFRTAPGAGFALDIRLPLAGPAAPPAASPTSPTAGRPTPRPTGRALETNPTEAT
jgi:signal transduction histidine kinase